MKKQLLSLLLLLGMYAGALAQTEKGNLVAGGSGYFHVQQQSHRVLGNHLELNAMLNPGVGYFIRDNISVGAVVPLTYYRTVGDLVVRSLGVGINPFVRTYIGPFTTRLVLEARGGVNAGQFYVRDATWGHDNEVKPYGNLGLGAGLVHFINKQVGLELMVSHDWHQENAIRPYTMRNGFNINLGLQAYISRQR